MPITPFPTLPLPGSRGTFAHVVRPGEVALANFIAARGLGISIPRGDPWAFDTRVFERWMSLSGKTRPLSKTGFSVRDYKDLPMFLKVAAH